MSVLFESAGLDSSFITPLVNALQPWQTLYSEHTSVSTTVLFLHLASLVASAGLAFANDRAVVRTEPANTVQRAQRLTELHLSHRSVLVALVFSFASGLLLLLADLEAFLGMPAFWIKMGLIALLMTNAWFMMRRERQLRAVAEAPLVDALPVQNVLWMRLRRHAYTSLALWFAVVLAGTAMTSS